MRNILNRVHNHFSYKRDFPHTFVSSQSHLTGNCVLGKATQIHGGAFVKDTTIGTNTMISSGTSVVASRLGSNVHVLNGSSLVEADIKDYTKIGDHCRVSNAQIDSYTFIAQETIAQHVQIGRFCSIGPRIIFGYGVHPTNLISTSPIFYSVAEQCGVTFSDQNYFDELRSIRVGHDVWIGAHVYIKDGISIGHGAVIGAGSVVTKDVPAYAIVVGTPARIIRYRFDERQISKLLSLEWWNWSEDKLRQAQPIFIQGNVDDLS